MSKIGKILLTGFILLLCGGIIFVICLAVSGWDIRFLSNVTAQEIEYTEPPESQLTNITIDYENTDILVYTQDAPTVRIVYPQSFYKNGEKATEVTITETENTLKITEKSINGWQFWNFTAPKTKLYLPADRTYTLTLSTNNGNVTLDGTAYSVNAISLTTDNGNIHTKKAITAQGKVNAETNNGNITLQEVSAQNITAETDNGNVCLYTGVATEQIRLETNNGNVTITKSGTANTVHLSSDNGNIEVDGVTAESITFETDVGNVEGTVIGKKSDFTITVEHNLGETDLYPQTGGAKTLHVETDIGNIEIRFTE